DERDGRHVADVALVDAVEEIAVAVQDHGRDSAVLVLLLRRLDGHDRGQEVALLGGVLRLAQLVLHAASRPILARLLVLVAGGLEVRGGLGVVRRLERGLDQVERAFLLVVRRAGGGLAEQPLVDDDRGRRGGRRRRRARGRGRLAAERRVLGRLAQVVEVAG